jgi:hypothetical protein
MTPALHGLQLLLNQRSPGPVRGPSGSEVSISHAPLGVLYPSDRPGGRWPAGKRAGGASAHPDLVHPNPKADHRSHLGACHGHANGSSSYVVPGGHAVPSRYSLAGSYPIPGGYDVPGRYASAGLQASHPYTPSAAHSTASAH